LQVHFVQSWIPYFLSTVAHLSQIVL